jgi:chromosome segregation ATPase
MGSIRDRAEASIQKIGQYLDEAEYRIEACIEADERNATAALEEIESARFALEDVRRSLHGLSESHEAFEGELQTLREMMGEYESRNAELEEAVRYLTGAPDEPVDDWKEDCPLSS